MCIRILSEAFPALGAATKDALVIKHRTPTVYRCCITVSCNFDGGRSTPLKIGFETTEPAATDETRSSAAAARAVRCVADTATEESMIDRHYAKNLCPVLRSHVAPSYSLRYRRRLARATHRIRDRRSIAARRTANSRLMRKQSFGNYFARSSVVCVPHATFLCLSVCVSVSLHLLKFVVVVRSTHTHTHTRTFIQLPQQ